MVSTFSSDNNHYLRPLDDNYIISATQSTGTKGYTLAGWQQRYGLDLSSKKSPASISPYVINSYLSSNKYSNGDFITSISGASCWNDIGSCHLSWDTTQLDGGALKVSFNSQIPTADSLLTVPVGTVSPGKEYILKYDFIADSNNGSSIMIYLRKRGSPYTILTPKYYKLISTSRAGNEILFSPSTIETDTAVVFEISKGDSTNNAMWFDNIQLYEADVTKTNPDDYIFFDYNPTFQDKAITLDGSYMDLDGNPVSGSVTIKPYESIILIKD
ncbi:MAG TPA: hypothetical protein ENH46_07170 [Candidatus Pacearchaeota archaeon]|nr:hypothetical protein [Candidatus Pacearchaeota archaeon]